MGDSRPQGNARGGNRENARNTCQLGCALCADRESFDQSRNLDVDADKGQASGRMGTGTGQQKAKQRAAPVEGVLENGPGEGLALVAGDR